MYEPTGNHGPVALISPWMPADDISVVWGFLDSAPVAVMAADDERRIVRVNEHWCALTGYDSEAAASRRVDDILAPESRPGIDMRWRDLLGAGLGTARVVVLRPDGSRLAVRYGAFANVVPGLHVGAYFAEPGQEGPAARPPRARRAGQL